MNPKIIARIVDRDEAESADMTICVKAGTPTLFSDNLTGACSICGCAIIFRPTAPQKPPKLCFECALGMAGDRH